MIVLLTGVIRGECGRGLELSPATDTPPSLSLSLSSSIVVVEVPMAVTETETEGETGGQCCRNWS